MEEYNLISNRILSRKEIANILITLKGGYLLFPPGAENNFRRSPEGYVYRLGCSDLSKKSIRFLEEDCGLTLRILAKE